MSNTVSGIDLTKGGTITGNLSVSGTITGGLKLTTARTFITNLASTTAGSFDGSKNVELGIKGVLDVQHGGTGLGSLKKNHIVTGNLTDPIATTKYLSARSLLLTIGTTNTDGWYRLCTLKTAGQVQAFLFLGGSWSHNAPTSAIVNLTLMHTKGNNLQLITCCNKGYLTKLRLVRNTDGTEYYLDGHLPEATSKMRRFIYFNFRSSRITRRTKFNKFNNSYY